MGEPLGPAILDAHADGADHAALLEHPLQLLLLNRVIQVAHEDRPATVSRPRIVPILQGRRLALTIRRVVVHIALRRTGRGVAFAVRAVLPGRAVRQGPFAGEVSDGVELAVVVVIVIDILVVHGGLDIGLGGHVSLLGPSERLLDLQPPAHVFTSTLDDTLVDGLPGV